MIFKLSLEHHTFDFLEADQHDVIKADLMGFDLQKDGIVYRPILARDRFIKTVLWNKSDFALQPIKMVIPTGSWGEMTSEVKKSIRGLSNQLNCYVDPKTSDLMMFSNSTKEPICKFPMNSELINHALRLISDLNVLAKMLSLQLVVGQRTEM